MQPGLTARLSEADFPPLLNLMRGYFYVLAIGSSYLFWAAWAWSFILVTFPVITIPLPALQQQEGLPLILNTTDTNAVRTVEAVHAGAAAVEKQLDAAAASHSTGPVVTPTA